MTASPSDPNQLRSSTCVAPNRWATPALGLERVRGQPLAGVSSATAGRMRARTRSSRAVYKTRNVPLYTVGIGDPSEPKDFEVSVDGPDIILPDDNRK